MKLDRAIKMPLAVMTSDKNWQVEDFSGAEVAK